MTEINCTCDEDRRDFLRKVGQTGVALGFAGLSLSNDLFVQEAFGEVARTNPYFDSVIQIFFRGGPSQTDTWDPKPGSNNNYFNTIDTGALDKYGDPMLISDVFPTLVNAVQNDPNVGLGLVRSMDHNSNSHGNGQLYMNTFWTGTLADVYPSTAAVMAHYFEGSGLGIPSVVINNQVSGEVNRARASKVPTALQVDAGGGVGGNPVVRALSLPTGVDPARYGRRKTMLDKLNARFLSSRPDVIAAQYEKSARDAVDITMKGDAAAAFDLTGVPLVPGADNGVRQRLTQAARLIEAGIPYVSMAIGGNDSHTGNMARIRRNWGQEVDGGVMEVVNRIKASGKKTLIMMGGEFGRNPTSIQNKDGRDHWGRGFSWAMVSVNQPAFKTGAIGDTGPDGVFQARNNDLIDHMEPKDLGAFMYRAMGFQVGAQVQYDVPLNDRDAPPVDRVNKGGELMTQFGLV
jgi:hypothetical protein